MNDSVTTPAGNGTNKPSHIAYQVRDGKDKGFWTRIGVAWTSRDEKGLVIQLNAVPLDGKDRPPGARSQGCGLITNHRAGLRSLAHNIV